MTFDSAVNTTFGEMLADLRDKVAGVTNYSLKDTSAGGGDASVALGEWFVITNPWGEDIRFRFRDTNGYPGLQIEYGPEWDDANDIWSDQYASDFSYFTENIISNSNYDAVFMPTENTQVREGDAVTYWLEYVDSGFGLYVQREEADGEDGDNLVVMEEVTQLWDYDAAAGRESNMIQIAGGYFGDANYVEGKESYEARMAASGKRPEQPAEGAVNPDDNFNNYPYHDGIAHSSRFQNADDYKVPIGKYDLALRERSGGDAAHRDTVQDASGTNVYTIVKRNVVDAALRMD